MKVAKSPGAVAAHGASEIDELRRHVGPEPSLPQICAQPICATLIGSNRCSAAGIIAGGYVPASALTRFALSSVVFSPPLLPSSRHSSARRVRAARIRRDSHLHTQLQIGRRVM